MCNIKDNTPTSNPNNAIVGSYTSVNTNKSGLDNIFYLPSIFNDNDLEKQYIEDKKNLEKYLYNIELINIQLLKKILFLNKICYFVNITHSNTINFIMKNNKNLKYLLDNYMFYYNKNLNKINLTKKKIDIINSNILYIENDY